LQLAQQHKSLQYVYESLLNGTPLVEETFQAIAHAEPYQLGGEEFSGKRMKRKRAVKEKDPNRPKKPPSAFLLFAQDFRDKIVKQNPDLNKKVCISSCSAILFFFRSFSKCSIIPCPHELK
jgi:hypothetical protein